MVQDKIFFNNRYNVWHISGWGYNFKNKKDAQIFKKLYIQITRLEDKVRFLKEKMRKLSL